MMGRNQSQQQQQQAQKPGDVESENGHMVLYMGLPTLLLSSLLFAVADCHVK